MRYSDCYKLSKTLLPHLPGFTTDRKDKIFMAPIGHTLRGFLFESTAGAREDFYFWWFFTPIGRPIDHLTLSYGSRFNVPGGHSGWNSNLANLTDKLLAVIKPKLPLLKSIKGIDDTIEAIRSVEGKRYALDINTQDTIACLYVLNGQFGEALNMLNEIIAHEHGTDRRQWILDIVERMKSLRAQLLADPRLAVIQVKAWQDYTFKALKLEKWR